MRYSIVTPARNEELNLVRLGAAVLNQTQQPAEWIVVDDRSTDATANVLAELSESHPGLRVIASDAGQEQIQAGRRQGRPLSAFLLGLDALSQPVDVIVKVDADVDFDSIYFETLMDRFAQDENLGIASGTCYEEENGTWTRRTKAASTVWGAARAYRIDCIPDLRQLEYCMGWDGLDEVQVQMRGMTTKTFTDIPFRHHRPEGARERTSLHQGEALGRASWYMGYRPSYLFMRAIYRARRDPAALAMIWGYCLAAAKRTPRCPDSRIVASIRQRQRLTSALRRGAPSS